MKAIDRRGLLRGLMIATAATAAGLAFGTRTSQAMPLDARIATPSDALIQKGAGCRCRSTAAPSPSLGLLVEQRPARLRLALVLGAGFAAPGQAETDYGLAGAAL